MVARALRDAGFDVLYTGIRQTPEMIVEAAVKESVDAIGLSILSGAHLDLFPLIMGGLKEKGLGRVAVFAGGTLPREDYPALKEMGIRGVFGPGSSLKEIVEFVRQVTGGGDASP
ncbi:MAG: cobalamin B12-binding domain protein [Dehalococcoidia bacterium]|nr:cobalamin B12-binding domain protein [Dehalococcoidia bacterium]